MKFIIEKCELTRLLRMLGGAPKKGGRSLLRLAAQDGQVIIEGYASTAGCAALVLEEGVCFFRAKRFLPLVRTYANTPHLTFEVTPDGIQIGSTQIGRRLWEVSLFQNPRTAPKTLVAPPSRKKPVPPVPQSPDDFRLESE